jgi:hypothetical protein
MILSTDMALHFEFMGRFEGIERVDAGDDKLRRLICCCIMKSADISNLVSPPLPSPRKFVNMVLTEGRLVHLIYQQIGL